jgi:tetratricopeptide (TPR) repeat protein
MYRLAAVSMIIMVTGCAAFGVPASSDPREKLGQAVYLYEKQDRPLPAERLIREAHEIYLSKSDDLGLAESYRQYAFLLKSPAVGHWEPHYRKGGFLDKSVSFDTRFEKAIEYLQKARDIYAKHGKYDALSNVNLVMGHIYLSYIGDENRACEYYDKSLEDHQEFMKVEPDAKISLPEGFESFSDYIAAAKKRAKCI